MESGETRRLEGLSDGVFAVAITLLILEVRVIRVPLGGLTERGLITALIEQWPSYLAFLASFATVGIMWMNHRRLFNLIGRADNTLLILNLLLLLAVTIFPFPTALVAEHIGHPGERVAAIVYTGMGVILAIFFNALWRYAAWKNRLLREDADPLLVRSISTSYLFGPLVYLLTVGLAFVNVPASLLVTIALALFFALPPGNFLVRAFH